MAMTAQQVAEWMRQQGIAEGVIADEAPYIAATYADPDEDPMAALQASLGSYLQRSQSGGDRAAGGYSTDEADPAIGDTSGWFSANAYGATPDPFGETYSTLARPESLQDPYTAPVWTETFRAPTAEEVQAEPGYAIGLQEGTLARERSAAARGSILSGGTQKALARYAADYASTKYGESVNRLFDQYQQRYGQFQDAAAAGLSARTANESAYQSDVGNDLNQYLTRFNAYQTAIGNTRNAENDLWSRTQDQIQNSLTAAGLAKP